ncbi:MAG: DUF1924 domain-containing protein [Betaproteobacteria bacterium]|nr:DUF1924 domain-containing protein [Betaproteobacteria bacterium]
MTPHHTLASLCLGLLMCTSALAADTHAAAQLQRFASEAGRAGQADAGRRFFVNKHGGEWACASCHGESPTQAGRHASTGKTLPTLAPAFNPKSLSETARIDKWFRRNCKDVLGRECQAGEKADVLAWLLSLQP